MGYIDLQKVEVGGRSRDGGEDGRMHIKRQKVA